MKLTDSAIERIRNLLAAYDHAIALRIGIVGGGCSGFNYTFSFAETVEEGDYVHQDGGVIVLVDPMSIMYLEDVTVDYTIDISGSMFVIDNPSAKTTCGCGTSFSV